MTIRDMEIFMAVAESGHMGLAAKKLYISQPTVSHAISQIEEDYHVKLFERLSRKLYITDAGKEFLQYTRHILSNFNDMEHFLRHASEEMCIRVGASLTVGSFFLADMISKFEKENPKIRIRVYIDNSKDIIQKISEGTLDLAVIEGSINSKDLISREVYEDELVLICGKSHPFASRKSVRLTDLANTDCVLREEGSGTRAIFVDLAESRGIPIVEKWICHSSDSIINIVASGQGVSILSKSLLLHNQNVVQLPVEDLTLKRSFRIIHHKDKYLSAAILSLMDEVERLFKLVHLESK
jgi:Transcriptional regulator